MDNLISSDILWSAQEAQPKTKEVLKNYNSQELSEISKRIKETVARGGVSIMYIGELSDGTVNKLKSLGYNIFDASSYSTAYEISWEWPNESSVSKEEY